MNFPIFYAMQPMSNNPPAPPAQQPEPPKEAEP